MASETPEAVALLSVRPRFARAIMSGEKRVEFRKVQFRRTVSHVVVYATGPIRRILGYFEVARLVEAPPKRLWDLYGGVGAIHHHEFYAYYRSSNRGTAIAIGGVYAFQEPPRLSVFGRWLKPPQSFRYIPRGVFDRIRAAPLAGAQTAS